MIPPIGNWLRKWLISTLYSSPKILGVMEHRTSKPEYVEPLLKALKKLMSASEEQLLDETFLLVQDRLHPADFIMLPNGVPRWMNQMQNMLDGLIESGRIVKEYGLLKLA